jgi:hypothetical protein
MIRHARLRSSFTIPLLTVAMILSSFRAALITAVGAAVLVKPGSPSAGEAAITLTAVTAGTDKELRMALPGLANPTPEDHLAMSRHMPSPAATGHREWLRGTLEPVWMSSLTKVAISGTLSL